ncbi:hypothetical protein RHMOL_Rhmol09G0013200 [Rhododendron molle]|uniref:Uncharacterized protein n=1 Tax=Rhododendron molle TaxID=49168 RepID=A0ACC0M8Q4_RHOML|nr:hypothetical protein RHMOL_Rhmol09G0013200 [Rhododendron molle]
MAILYFSLLFVSKFNFSAPLEPGRPDPFAETGAKRFGFHLLKEMGQNRLFLTHRQGRRAWFGGSGSVGSNLAVASDFRGGRFVGLDCGVLLADEHWVEMRFASASATDIAPKKPHQ